MSGITLRLLPLLCGGLLGVGGVAAGKQLWTAAAAPGSLTATISGPSEVPIGKLATLSAEVQGATLQRWYPINPVYDHECPSGLTITGDRPEVRKYALFVASATESLIVEHSVKIVSPGDAPTPRPPDGNNPCPPDDSPSPPIPVPADLTAQAREWLQTVPANSLDKKAAIVSGVSGIISAISRGSLSTVGEVDQALRAALVAATKLDVGWLKFGTSYNTEIEQRKADGRISTPSEYAAALSQILEALR